jgi:hypothetical protein
MTARDRFGYSPTDWDAAVHAGYGVLVGAATRQATLDYTQFCDETYRRCGVGIESGEYALPHLLSVLERFAIEQRAQWGDPSRAVEQRSLVVKNEIIPVQYALRLHEAAGYAKLHSDLCNVGRGAPGERSEHWLGPFGDEALAFDRGAALGLRVERCGHCFGQTGD